VTKNLQQAENAHKQTMAELQRTRNALQTVRATHQAEQRKKDKEFEKLADKWSKIADVQTKLGATASGLRFSGSSANAAVVNGSQFGKGKGYLEVALDQAEKAREQLTLENTGLRMLVVRVANEVQRVTHEVKRYMPGTSQDAEEVRRPLVGLLNY
jgi:chromosome segregation ATPase